MKAGKETAMYNQGYMDGYNEGENAHIDPDYWTRLEHQYAGMAMQGILANYGVEPLPDDVAHDAYNYAHTLVEMMKEERK